MRAHLSNAAYGVLDYAAHPLAMLLAAPLLLRHLGATSYGVWVVAMAAVSIGSIIASGFGDANIQYVATMSSRGDTEELLRAVRGLLGINLLLGSLLFLISWILVPFAARHLVSYELQTACLWSLRIACLLMLIRAIESVCISTQRAFQRYGAAVYISIYGRLLTLASATLLTYLGFGVVCVMAATAIIIALGTIVQFFQLKHYLKADSLMPAFNHRAISTLFGFGIYSWLLAVTSVIFGQADRLILGVSLGAATVTSYALCIQLAQPIYGIASSGLHFVFPYLSSRQASVSSMTLSKTIVKAFAVNFLVVSVGTLAVLLLGRPFLHAWVGKAIAESSTDLLAPIVWSFALLGLNVTAYYALLALGHVRTVTWISLSGGVVMLILMAWLLPNTGIHGVITARLCYGLITLLMYYPLSRVLRNTPKSSLPTSDVYSVCEDV